MADVEVARRFDQTRWGNLFFGGLKPYFQTLRAVKRFLSTLSFHVAVFRSQQAFEVNPIDLIALETLRMFEPAVHRFIRENKAALTERHENDQAREAVRTIVSAASQGREAQVKEIVKQLFPSTDSTLDESWELDLRVCSDDIFDRYFVLTTPEGEISETEIVNLLVATHDRTAFRTALQRLAADGLLKVTLERLEAYKQKIDPGMQGHSLRPCLISARTFPTTKTECSRYRLTCMLDGSCTGTSSRTRSPKQSART